LHQLRQRRGVGLVQLCDALLARLDFFARGGQRSFQRGDAFVAPRDVLLALRQRLVELLDVLLARSDLLPRLGQRGLAAREVRARTVELFLECGNASFALGELLACCAQFAIESLDAALAREERLLRLGQNAIQFGDALFTRRQLFACRCEAAVEFGDALLAFAQFRACLLQRTVKPVYALLAGGDVGPGRCEARLALDEGRARGRELGLQFVAARARLPGLFTRAGEGTLGLGRERGDALFGGLGERAQRALRGFGLLGTVALRDGQLGGQCLHTLRKLVVARAQAGVAFALVVQFDVGGRQCRVQLERASTQGVALAFGGGEARRQFANRRFGTLARARLLLQAVGAGAQFRVQAGQRAVAPGDHVGDHELTDGENQQAEYRHQQQRGERPDETRPEVERATTVEHRHRLNRPRRHRGRR